MIELLDYILDNDNNFWIVNNITSSNYMGYIVYRVSDEGKYNKITGKKYIKDTDISGIINIPSSYKKVFKPHMFYINDKNNLTGIWKQYVDVLNEIGIPDEDIGIFGSYLIGFDISKDVDFVIYGKENLYKYYNNIGYIRKKLNVSSISTSHVEYQYNKHKAKFNNKCDLKEIISRNWSGIELNNGVLSTPRFIDKSNYVIPIKKGNDMTIRVKIINGFLSSMLPRAAKVEYNGRIYTIISSIWKYQSFAHKNDILEIYANVNDKENLIIIDKEQYYIRYLNKSNIIK